MPENYPDDFIHFCNHNKLEPPQINMTGKALLAMLTYQDKYFKI